MNKTLTAVILGLILAITGAALYIGYREAKIHIFICRYVDEVEGKDALLKYTRYFRVPGGWKVTVTYIWVENRGKQFGISSTGCKGAMQPSPDTLDTARGLCEKTPELSHLYKKNDQDWEFNIMAGCSYLKGAFEKFSEEEMEVVQIYCKGIGSFWKKRWSSGYAEDYMQTYVIIDRSWRRFLNNPFIWR